MSNREGARAPEREPGTTVRLDNQDFDGNFFPGYTKINRASLEVLYVSGDGLTHSEVWVDDIKYEREVPTSDVKNWSVY